MFLLPIFFTKLSASGNNFLIINYLEQSMPSLDYATLAKDMTDSITGISSDGILLLVPSELADIKIIIYNQDGSRAQTCGNGLRLLGHYLLEIDRFLGPTLTIETDTNVSTLTRDNHEITVDLGLAHSLIDPYQTILLDSHTNDYCGEVETSLGTWPADMISMGNPHFIIYTDEDHDAFISEIKRISKRYDVNVGIVTIINQTELKLTTYERGAGLTGACGTNAAAAVASAVARGMLKPYESITVYAPGGELMLTWNQDAHLLLDGRCTKICCGTYFFDNEKKDN